MSQKGAVIAATATLRAGNVEVVCRHVYDPTQQVNTGVGPVRRVEYQGKAIILLAPFMPGGVARQSLSRNRVNYGVLLW